MRAHSQYKSRTSRRQWDVWSWLTVTSDSGTMVSSSSGDAIRSIMNLRSTPSPESLWEGDFIMSMMDIPARTHNDSIDEREHGVLAKWGQKI